MKPKNTFFTLIISMGLFFSSCGGSVEVSYDVPLEQMIAEARKTGRDFCVVLSRADCPPCSEYVKMMTGERAKKLLPNLRYNVVDVSMPENQWHTQWLCSGAFPTTCLFSAVGELKAVVAGIDRSSLDCLKSAATGDAKCADYFYHRLFQVRGKYLDALNDLLACKRDFDSGKDIGSAVDACLGRMDHPWAVWLKALNAQRQGRAEEAAAAGRRLQQFTDTYFYRIYGDIFAQAKYLVNPDFDPAEDAVLSLPEDDIVLEGCKVDEPRMFAFEVRNTGKFPLIVSGIQVSCSCLKLLTSNNFSLEAGESSRVEAEFTPDSRGDVFREILFFSNTTESMKSVIVRATVR